MHALRKTLPTVASQETETESQTTTCVLQISIGENLSTKHELGFFFFFFPFSRLLGPRNYPPPASLQSRGTCHLAQGLEPHPPDTCQAGAETPPGCLPLAPEPRPLSPSSRRSASVGDREGPSSRRDPAPSGDAPRPDAPAPAATHPLGVLPVRRPPQRLCSLTWPEAGPRGHCPVRGLPQQGVAAAAVPGVRRRRRRLLSGGLWAA